MKKKKRGLFHKNLDRTLEHIGSAEGIGDTQIDSHHIEHLPGFSVYWENELQERLKEIKDFDDRNFLSRWMKEFWNDEDFDEATGDEIYDLHPSKEAKRLLKQVGSDPLDMEKRLALVSLIAKSGRNFSLQAYRDLLLQATTACCFGELSSAGLRLVIQVQEAYLRRFVLLCQKDEIKLSNRLKNPGESTIYKRQFDQLHDQLDQIQHNAQLSEFLQKYSARGLQSATVVTLSISEIESYQKRAARQHQEIFKKLYEVVSLLRYLPLLHEEGHRYLDLVSRLDPTHPIPDFLRARLFRSQLQLKIQQYRSGHRNIQIEDQILQFANNTYKAYGRASKKVAAPKSKTDSTIIFEYADFLYDFYRFSSQLMYTYFPKEWLKKAFTRAIKSVELLPPSGEVTQLVNNIHHALEIENIRLYD